MHEIEEIIEKTRELAESIKKCKTYRDFTSHKKSLEEFPDLKQMLDSFKKKVDSAVLKQQNHVQPESFELQEIKDLSQEISNNEILAGYIKSEAEYLSLIGEIQRKIIS